MILVRTMLPFLYYFLTGARFRTCLAAVSTFNIYAPRRMEAPAGHRRERGLRSFKLSIFIPCIDIYWELKTDVSNMTRVRGLSNSD